MEIVDKNLMFAYILKLLSTNALLRASGSVPGLHLEVAVVGEESGLAAAADAARAGQALEAG